MLGRCQKLEDIHILTQKNIEREDIKVDEDALKESNRLKEEFLVLKEVEEQNFLNYFTISYVNINRVIPHLDDVKNDEKFMRSDVFSLGETWLQPDDSVSFEDENFLGSQVNVGDGKGIMAFAKIKHNANTTTYFCETFSAIYMETATTDVIFLYLSNKFDWLMLKDLFQSWINPQKCVAVIGDVNIDFIDEDHQMFWFLKEYGFSQLIEKPTHIRGGLIDHIYVNKVLIQKNPFTSQRSVTYSDHDIIVLHIPLENK